MRRERIVTRRSASACAPGAAGSRRPVAPLNSDRAGSGGKDYVWITEHTQYGYNGRSYAVSIVGFRDDEVSRETRYFANPFEASRWSAQWVRHMEK